MSTERIALSDADVAYLVGRGGQTRIRLENFSGARMQIDRDAAEVCAISRGYRDTLCTLRLGFHGLCSEFCHFPAFRTLCFPALSAISLFASPLSRME